MNKPIRYVAVGCFALFVALLLNVTWLQYFRADELNADPRNQRVIETAFSRERGAILAGKQVIATSKPSTGRFAFQRTYPQATAEEYSTITGAFTLFSQSGLERTQNELLSGDDDRLFVNRMLDILSNAEPKGGNVRTTIYPAAQDAAWQGLKALGPDVEGAVVAIEPSTGKILASVSTPTFDPNKMASHDAGAVLEYSKKLEKDPADPLTNRATRLTLPPGSTFKLVTAAAAIEEYDLTAESMVPAGSGFKLPQSSTVVGNEGGGNCGGEKITLSRAMEVSCNVTFLKLANRLGNAKMRAMAEKLGFNTTSLKDLPGQAPSLYPEMDAPQTAMSGIGQASVTATPLQMAMVVATIANDGVPMRPYVVDQVTAPNLDVLEESNPEDLDRAMKSSTAAELTKMLVATVEQGTATNAAIPGEQVAGKTGTAQSTPERPPYAWFVSFAPADDNPKVAVAVLVQSSDTDRNEIAGGRLGAPIAKSVMEAVLRR